MIVFRLLAIFIFAVLLTGCTLDVPNEKTPKCGPPGVGTTRCYYILKITQIDDLAKGLVRGKVDEKVVQDNEIQTRISSKPLGLVTLKTEKDTYPFFEYRFEVEDATGLQKDGVYGFVSDPKTGKLKKCADTTCIAEGVPPKKRP